jgi:hypothetical protein
MPNVSIENVRSVQNFAHNFRWNFEVVTPPSDFPELGQASEGMNIRCETASVPKRNMNYTPTTIRGHTVEQAANAEYDREITLMFNETDDNFIVNLMRGWEQVAYESITGDGNDKEFIQATLKLVRLDSQNIPRYQYVIYGCQPGNPTEIPNLGNGDGGGEIIKAEWQIKYDYWIGSEI